MSTRSLVENLELAVKVSADLEELIRDARSSIKALRQIQTETVATIEAATADVKATIAATAAQELKALSDVTADTIEKAEKAVFHRFDTICNILLTGQDDGNGPNILATAARAGKAGEPFRLPGT